MFVRARRRGVEFVNTKLVVVLSVTQMSVSFEELVDQYGKSVGFSSFTTLFPILSIVGWDNLDASHGRVEMESLVAPSFSIYQY